MTAWNGRELLDPIPPDAIADCTTPGQDASESVDYWIKSLAFDAPAEYTREYLKSCGAWDADELADHDANIRRLFWVICGNLRDDPDCPIYLES